MIARLGSMIPGLTWRIPTSEQVLYLTFDDGPIPVVTPWVLDTLAAYGAKATFFCVGQNARNNPEILDRIKKEGHALGNHTMNHVNGWKTPVSAYVKEVEACSQYVTSAIFRPPYGRISPRQYWQLRKAYKIIYWDVISRDYNESLSGAFCAKRVIDNARKGSIVVFHDSLKAEERLRIALPETLKHFSALGYRFDALP